MISNCGDRPACRLDMAYCKLQLPVKDSSRATESTVDVLFINGGMDTEGNLFDDSFLIRLA